MPHYRFHILDQRGDLMGAVGFDSADDKAAKAFVAPFLDGHHGELWRLVPLVELQGPIELFPPQKPPTLNS